MQMLNRYFTPFALLLIISAVYFNNMWEDAHGMTQAALGILSADVLINWWIGRNQYRWLARAHQLRLIQVWLNYVWAVLLFGMLYPFWAPMWLLFVVAPTAAAITLSRTHTVFCGVTSAVTMIAVYWHRQPLEGVFLGMALSHAVFIVIFSLFVHGLAQSALRLRDANLS